MRKLDSRIIIAIIFFVAAGLYYFYVTSASAPIDTYGPAPKESVRLDDEKKEPAAITKMSEERKAAEAAAAAGAALNQNSEAQSPKVQLLQTWLASEAKNLDQPNVDTKQKDLELKKRIENFSEEEKQLVLQASIDSKRPANERILSAYMLVLDQSQTSVENLNALAKKSLPDFGPVTAHSEAEIRRGQELAVRYMAVDELAKRAPGNPEALESLKELANSGESAEIRGYAQRMLKQIK